jgi:hypothetical protein
MLRILLLLICLGGAINAVAQKAGRESPKVKEKEGDPKIDYEQIGSPMPALKLLVYYDTSTKRDTVTMSSKKNDDLTAANNSNNKTRGNKKRRHHAKTAEERATQQGEKKQYLTNSDFDNNANLLVMLFNPNCSHCQDETEMLEKNIFYFNKTKLLMVASPLALLYLPGFAQSYHVAEYPSICLGIDSSNFLNKIFLYRALPQINVYDKDRRLVKIFCGDVAIDSLKAYIQ